jgi:hypothetical protein
MSTPERVVFDIRDEFDSSMAGWSCKNLMPVTVSQFEPRLHKFLYEGEPLILGDEMIKRAKELGIITGLRHAEAIIRCDRKVNKAFGNFILLFPEVWFGSGGACVWCLYPISGYWQLNYDEIRHGFNSDYRLVSA